MKVPKVAWLLLISLGSWLQCLNADEGINGHVSVAFSADPTTNTSDGGARGGEDDADDGLPIPIIIMALARSGSTLIGDLFKNDKDMFYMYEPCRSRGMGVLGNYKAMFQEDCLAFLQSIFRCDFTVNEADQLLSDKSAGGHSSPIFQEMRATLDEGRNEGGGTRAREALDQAHRMLLDTCKGSRAVVVKTIRVYDRVDESTSSLVSGINFLHLVRDPRAVVRSELMHFGMGHFREDLPNFRELKSISDPVKRLTEERRAIGGILCGYYRMQLDSRPHFDGKYLRVRYEDFSMLPQVVTQLIFSYFGLGDVPPSLAAWIEENTSMEGCGDTAGSGSRRGLRRSQILPLLPIGEHGAGLFPNSGDIGHGSERIEGTVVTEADAADFGIAPGVANAAVPQPRRKMLRSTVESSLPIAAGFERSPPQGRRAQQSSPSAASGGGALPSNGVATPNVGETATRAQGFIGGANAVQARVRDGEVVITKEGRRALQESGCSNEREAMKHPFDTKRDSQAMAYLWREEMSLRDSMAVWEACQDSRVMLDLNYAP